LKLLLSKNPVDRNAKDQYGKSPLHLATGNGFEEAVRLFLAEEVVDLESNDNLGQTPLSWASKKGHFGIVKLLREYHHKMGIAINNGDLDVATCPVVDFGCRILCDVCLCWIPDTNVHYHCEICRRGNFDVCRECFACGAICFDQSHKLMKRMIKNDRLVEVPD
jgi:Ankyrin repeats (3 copies)